MLSLDVPGQAVNTLRAELADEFDTLIELLARRHGARFEPAPMLQALAARGGRFHVPRPA